MTETEAALRSETTPYNRWTGKKDWTFENIEIPEEFGPIEIKVTESVVKQYAFCMDDYRSWHFDASPFGAPVAHAALLANDLYTVYFAQYDRTTTQAGLHTTEELFFHAPVPIGETVTITGRLVDKYVRRGGGYVVLEAEARDRRGDLLVSHRSSEIMRVHPGSIGRSSAPASDEKIVPETNDASPVDKAATAIAPGTPTVSKAKTPSQAQISVYSFVGEHERNVHNDLAMARKAGLDNTIAQGLHVVGYFSELCTDFYGVSWFTSGRLKAKFILPIYCDSTLTLSGKVSSQVAEGSAIRTHLEMWAKDQDGRMVSVAWASGLHDV